MHNPTGNDDEVHDTRPRRRRQTRGGGLSLNGVNLTITVVQTHTRSASAECTPHLPRQMHINVQLIQCARVSTIHLRRCVCVSFACKSRTYFTYELCMCVCALLYVHDGELHTHTHTHIHTHAHARASKMYQMHSTRSDRPTAQRPCSLWQQINYIFIASACRTFECGVHRHS